MSAATSVWSLIALVSLEFCSVGWSFVVLSAPLQTSFDVSYVKQLMHEKNLQTN